MSTIPQWPVWTCPHCGETWHSGREYCVTCKHGMVQVESGQWVPQSALPPDTVLPQTTSAPPAPSSAPATAVIEQAFRDMTTLQQETALREDRIRRVEGELARAQQHAEALEREQAAFLQRAEMAEKRLAEYEEQVYLWCKPLLMALRDEGVPVSLDTVIPATVERVQQARKHHFWPNPAAGQELAELQRLSNDGALAVHPSPDVKVEPATTQDVLLAMVAQLELRIQELEAIAKPGAFYANISKEEAERVRVEMERVPGRIQRRQQPLTQQEGAWQGDAVVDPSPPYRLWNNEPVIDRLRQAQALTGPQYPSGKPAYPTWILTDAMQARLERDLIQEQTLRGGPAYGGETPRR